MLPSSRRPLSCSPTLQLKGMSTKFLISKALKEVRFHLARSGEASAALQKFLTLNYQTLKSSTSYRVPILIRESSDIVPSVTARFEKGREVKTSLEGLDDKVIEGTIKDLLK